MTNMTLALPKDLHESMRKHKNVKWSEVAREALRAHAEKLERMNQLLANSELTEADAERIGKAIKNGIAQQHAKS